MVAFRGEWDRQYGLGGRNISGPNLNDSASPRTVLPNSETCSDYLALVKVVIYNRSHGQTHDYEWRCVSGSRFVRIRERINVLGIIDHKFAFAPSDLETTSSSETNEVDFSVDHLPCCQIFEMPP